MTALSFSLRTGIKVSFLTSSTGEAKGTMLFSGMTQGCEQSLNVGSAIRAHLASLVGVLFKVIERALSFYPLENQLSKDRTHRIHESSESCLRQS